MRALALVGTWCILFSLAGCSSNNTGKILGKWQMTGGRPPGANELWEFTADAKVSATLEIGARRKILKGTYTLGSGDTVNLHLDEEFGGRKDHSLTMEIKGDELTMVDSDGTKATFKKVK
jgi:uncharacterized protein (TIGR03066 family)